MFISSLTDNQGFAAGIGIAVILLNYFSVSLSEYVSTTAVHDRGHIKNTVDKSGEPIKQG